MPRNQRCVMPGQAYHITQRGTNRQRVFFTDSDRSTYLKLMSQNLEDAGVRVLAWCLMKNHVHFVAVPERADSLSVLWRRVHGRFAQMMNARLLRSLEARLTTMNIEVLVPRRLSPNDGAVSYGQAAVAAARLRQEQGG